MIATTFLQTNVVSATFARTNVVSATMTRIVRCSFGKRDLAGGSGLGRLGDRDRDQLDLRLGA